MMSIEGKSTRYALAFDTANEVIAIGLGRLDAACDTAPDAVLDAARDAEPDAAASRIECIASIEQAARRASNTRLLSCIDELLDREKVPREDIACVVCGRGPGSFTGVRIAMATAKGIAQALPGISDDGCVESAGVPLIGVSSLDAVAWNAWAHGVRGALAVVADAMRHEVYPVMYALSDDGAVRLQADSVMKVEAAAEMLGALDVSEVPGTQQKCDLSGCQLQIAGDALAKYEDLFASHGMLLPQDLWAPTGCGLLLAAEAAWKNGTVDPFDAKRHNPAFALPVYTRLSDAEENERKRLAQSDERDLRTGVQGGCIDAQDADGPVIENIEFLPLDRSHVSAVVALEKDIMGSNAWSETLLAVDLAQKNRTWWMCVETRSTGLQDAGTSDGGPAGKFVRRIARAARDTHDIHDAPVVLGYAGGLIAGDDVEILKVAVVPPARRRGIARELLARVAEDARNLGASTVSLEVRAGNTGAQALYASLGMESLGTRPRYYQDGEDALIMKGSLEGLLSRGVAGMELENHARAADSVAFEHPLIFAIESSCDETAAAIVDGTGKLLADVVASQIDFHARFGGVVPEIASRKHIEAICGVCDECFDVAAERLGKSSLNWKDMDAVSVTYAPGLVGALVVGVAFAKGAAWAADVPFIGVNHLEGHLYANKLTAGFEPPAIVSLVSGGNTMLVHMKNWGSYETLGTTIDDAVGEAFDKVAKALGLGYPGGPIISRLADQGNPSAIAFPRAMMHSGDLRFSLSGLKTAVVTYINQEREAGRDLNMPDIAASFQQAVIDVQVAKASTALEQTGARTFCLGGGVAANPALRRAYEELCEHKGVKLVMPPLASCGDNAGMIALVALDRYRSGRFFGLDADAFAHADLDEPY